MKDNNDIKDKQKIKPITFPLKLNSKKFLCIKFNAKLHLLVTKSEPNMNNIIKENKILNSIIHFLYFLFKILRTSIF